MITYFKDKTRESKLRTQIYNVLSTYSKTFDGFVVFCTFCTSVTFCVSGLGLALIRISTGLAFGLITNKNFGWKQHIKI